MPERDAVPDFNPRNPVGEVIKSLDKPLLPEELPIDIAASMEKGEAVRLAFPADTPIIIVPNEASLKNLAKPIVVADRAGYDKMREVLEAGGLI